jgi:multidrug resistance efflux pump
MKGKAKLVLLIPALAVAGVLVYLHVTRQLKRDSGVLRVSGNMEVTEVDLSFRIPGWVDKRLVDEGQAVTRDKVVALLDPTELSQQVELNNREYVAAGTPIVTVADLTDIWLRAYVNEADLGRVKFGQKARVTTDTYPDKAYEGTISFIASEAEFTPKNVQTPTERVKLVYRVKITVANAKMELKPGMPADAEIVLAD